MRRYRSQDLAVALLVAIATCLDAQAATRTRVATAQAGQVCQLSIPSSTASVRVAATGFRNEDTKNVFVTCGMPAPSGSVTDAHLWFESIDGIHRHFECTSMNGRNDATGFRYLTHGVDVPLDRFNPRMNFVEVYAQLYDGGQLPGSELPNGPYLSITCLLPPGVAVTSMELGYLEDVGS